MQHPLKRGDRVTLNEDGKLKLCGGSLLLGWDGVEPVIIAGFETLNTTIYAKLVFCEVDTSTGELEESDFNVPLLWLELAPPETARLLN